MEKTEKLWGECEGPKQEHLNASRTDKGKFRKDSGKKQPCYQWSLSGGWVTQSPGQQNICSGRSHHQRFGCRLVLVPPPSLDVLVITTEKRMKLPFSSCASTAVGKSKTPLIIEKRNHWAKSGNWFLVLALPETLMFWLWISYILSQTGAYLKNERL